MQVCAERGELRITRETFAEHFDAWLKGHHRASRSTREGYRAAGERRLKSFFGPMPLSAIDLRDRPQPRPREQKCRRVLVGDDLTLAPRVCPSVVALAKGHSRRR